MNSMDDAGLAKSAANPSFWIVALKVIVALAFAAHGVAELAGVPMMVATFDKLGVGQWLRYATGLIEIGGAILLWTGYRKIGAFLLCATAVCAVGAHLFLVGGMFLPALVLAVLSGLVLYVNISGGKRDAAI